MILPDSPSTQEAALTAGSRSGQTASRRQWQHLAFLFVRLAAGVILLAAAFRRIAWGEVLPTIGQASLLWLLAAFATVLLSLGLRIWRWRLLLANYQVQASFWSTAAAYLIGQAANTLLPFRGGEILRFSWLRMRASKGSVPMVVSIAVEKYLDLLMLLLFFVWVIPYLPLEIVQANLTVLLSACALLTLLILLGAVYGRRIGRWLGGVLSAIFPVTRPYLGPLLAWLEDSAWMQSPRRFAPVVGLSLAAWVVMAATNQGVLRAVGLGWDWRASLLVLVLVYVGVVPAITPGNVGPFHFFAMLALTLVGIDGPQSAVFALFLHLLVTLPPILLSAVLILASGLARKFSREGGRA